MRKLTFLFVVVALFAVACKSDSTVEGGSFADALGADTSDGNTGDENTTDGNNADGNTADGNSGDGGDAPPPTQPPAPTTPPANNPAGAFLLSDDWCEAARQVEDEFDTLEFLDPNNPATLEQTYTQIVAIMGEAQRIAPPELQAPLATVLAGFTTINQELAAVGWSFLDLDVSVIENLDDQMSQATFDIERYNFEVCGIDNGFDPADDPSLQPPDPTFGDTPPLEGSFRDQAVEGLVQSGFTPDEANCLLDRLDFTDPAAFSDPNALFEVFSACGISLDRLGQLGG